MAESNNNTTQVQSAELSLPELAVKLRNIFQRLLRAWKLILVLGLTGLLIGFVYAKYIAVPTYKGELSFVLSNESKAGGIAGLASSFGVDLGGGAEGAFTGENIIQLLRSKKMVSRALFRVYPGGTQNLLNYYIDNTKLGRKWKEGKHTSRFLPFPNDERNINPVQDSLLNALHLKLLEDNVEVLRPDKKLSFYKVVVTSTQEEFSKVFTQYLVDETAEFYIETKTRLAKRNLSMLQGEADSLRGMLSGTIQRVAEGTDQTFNLNPGLQAQRTPVQRNQLQTQVLVAAYGEVVKNLELAKINLLKETPLYQLIDTPADKLKKIKPGTILSMLVGGVLFGILACVYVLIKNNRVANG